MSQVAGLSFNQQHMGYAYNQAAYPAHAGCQSFIIDNGAGFPGAPSYSYPSATYSQSVPAPAAVVQPPPPPQQQQQQQPPPTHELPKQHTSMAAPPFLPQSPATSSLAAGNAASTPSTPRSPGTRQREQQRMDLLMEINVELLQEVSKLQAEGKGGATTPQHAAQLKQQGQPSDLASQEYIDALRHVQANFTYLMPAAQGDASKTPHGPALLGPPAHMPQLQPKYDQLRELFPGWSGLDQRGGHSSASPQPNGTATT